MSRKALPGGGFFIFMNQIFSKQKIYNFLVRNRILIGACVVAFLIFSAYLKNYRLEYCKTHYPSTNSASARGRCLQQPLYKFIF